MAPHHFWLKRQFPGGVDIPVLSDIIPRPSSQPSPSLPSTSVPSASASAPSSVSPSSRSTPPSASTPAPARPTQSAIEEEEEEPVESQVEPSSTPTEDGILVTPAPTPAAQITESIANSEPHTTSTFTAKSTVFEDGAPSNTGVPGQIGAAKGNAFLENKVLSGVVFAICGVVGLVIIGFIIWIATRKARQTKKLEQEIISWDPDHVRGFNNASATHASKDAETRSLDGLDEKVAPGSLDGHYTTYAPPSQNMHAQSNPAAAGAYSNYYGAQRPIQVTLPPSEGPPYRANW